MVGCLYPGGVATTSSIPLVRHYDVLLNELVLAKLTVSSAGKHIRVELRTLYSLLANSQANLIYPTQWTNKRRSKRSYSTAAVSYREYLGWLPTILEREPTHWAQILQNKKHSTPESFWIRCHLIFYTAAYIHTQHTTHTSWLNDDDVCYRFNCSVYQIKKVRISKRSSPYPPNNFIYHAARTLSNTKQLSLLF